MYSTMTPWVNCGMRKRRAILTAETAELAEKAAEYYNKTSENLSTEDRIDRAIHLFRVFKTSCKHQYDPEI